MSTSWWWETSFSRNVAPIKINGLFMINGIYHVNYSVRNRLDKLESFQPYWYAIIIITMIKWVSAILAPGSNQAGPLDREYLITSSWSCCSCAMCTVAFSQDSIPGRSVRQMEITVTSSLRWFDNFHQGLSESLLQQTVDEWVDGALQVNSPFYRQEKHWRYLEHRARWANQFEHPDDRVRQITDHECTDYKEYFNGGSCFPLSDCFFAKLPVFRCKHGNDGNGNPSGVWSRYSEYTEVGNKHDQQRYSDIAHKRCTHVGQKCNAYILRRETAWEITHVDDKPRLTRR